MNVFLVPVYNEAPNMPALAASLMQAGGGALFVFVDDGSTDGTPDAIRRSFPEGRCRVMENKVNRGPGYSFNAGFEWIAANASGDKVCVVTLEGDNTSDLSVLPAMFSKMDEGHDLVLASVYAPGGGFSRPSHYRKFISNLANGMLRRVFRLDTLTLTSFFRVYDAGLLRRIKEKFGSFCDERGYLCKVELLLRARACGARIAEVPVTLQSHRRIGRSKMKVLKTGIDCLRFIVRHFRSYRRAGK
jgi:dolichol-phosphate mannosyltransferase